MNHWFLRPGGGLPVYVVSCSQEPMIESVVNQVSDAKDAVEEAGGAATKKEIATMLFPYVHPWAGTNCN